MKRRNLSVRLNPGLYEALSTLSGVVHRSMNDLVGEAVTKLVAEESGRVARGMEETLSKLRRYSAMDPGFDGAINQVAAAEVEHTDPLESDLTVRIDPVRDNVARLLKNA